MVPEKPWKLEAIVRLLLSIFVCACSVWLVVDLSARLAGWGAPDENSLLYLLGATLGLHGSILAMVWVFLWRQGIGWREAFGFSTPGLARAVGMGVLISLVFLPVGLMLQWESAKILDLLNVKMVQQAAVKTLVEARPGFNQAYYIAFTIIIAPLAEETLFRGLLYPTVKQYGFPRAARYGTSILFALIHNSPPIFIPLTVLALALVYLYEKTGNLLACVVAHGTFNAANILLLYHDDLGFHLPG